MFRVHHFCDFKCIFLPCEMHSFNFPGGKLEGLIDGQMCAHIYVCVHTSDHKTYSNSAFTLKCIIFISLTSEKTLLSSPFAPDTGLSPQDWKVLPHTSPQEQHGSEGQLSLLLAVGNGQHTPGPSPRGISPGDTSPSSASLVWDAPGISTQAPCGPGDGVFRARTSWPPL